MAPFRSPETSPLAVADPSGFASPHEEALLTLMRSADCLHRAFQHRLKPYGLTQTQYNVLRILRRSHSNGLTCSAIGSRMITPEPDITRLLSRLKAQKLVRQQRDTIDKRVVWTHITTQGLEILENLDGIVGEAPRELLHELTGEELRRLTYLLNKARCCAGVKADSPPPNPPKSPRLDPPTELKSTAKPPSRHSPRSFPLRHPPE